MLEMIPGASRLQIECGLFLWLTSYVGKLLQVMDVPCMCYGELKLIHGSDGHGEGKNSMGMAKGLGEDDVGLCGYAHHVLGDLQHQQLSQERSMEGDRASGVLHA